MMTTMKIATLPLTLLGLTAYSLSSITAADWDTGACPGGGSAPCIETEINDNTYHFNGTGGGHADAWHGRPAAEGGGDFVFEGDGVPFYCDWSVDCALAWSGKIKKCQDNNGNWRVGFQINGASMSNGTFCGLHRFSGFPWYTKDPGITPHCPFEDDCDSLIPYDGNASSYTANVGNIGISALGVPLVEDEHLQGVIFSPGVGANFAFASDFYNCDDDANCYLDGALTIKNAASLDIQ
ncbi:hypothetical protein [Alloalcanivorax profundimaris]|uniref:hypothetical protein n=1 Tax=Alloalcanivorax profundimaris TaxID=2735259 RepID=UPI0018894DC1|nr:hypothetical protein [Alloalcanivorax profundimaris]MBF1802567.1 hypothetical protein [Alloalcanivorax profundimaris]MCQ6263563.1 hypothetical protein [Alcanivorax sp. MM125-6]